MLKHFNMTSKRKTITIKFANISYLQHNCLPYRQSTKKRLCNKKVNIRLLDPQKKRIAITWLLIHNIWMLHVVKNDGLVDSYNIVFKRRTRRDPCILTQENLRLGICHETHTQHVYANVSLSPIQK